MAKNKTLLLNKKIWGDVDFFEKNWNILKTKDVAREDDHPIKLTRNQWTSLSTYHDSSRRYGEKRIKTIIKNERDILSNTDRQLTIDNAFDIMYATKKPDKKLLDKWERKIG